MSELVFGLALWFTLGLIAVLAAGGRNPQADGKDTRREAPEDTELPVYCLVCHRLIGRDSVPVGNLDGRLLTARELEWNTTEKHFAA